MDPTQRANPEVVLFDLGGVIVELSGVTEFGAMLGDKSLAEVWRTWLHSPAVRRFERGETGPEAFASELVSELDLPVRPDAFLIRYANWVRGLYPDALALIEGVRGSATVACLSNTNDLHWQGPMRRFGLHDAFDRCFLSHQMGRLKPDPDVFEYVLSALDVEPRSVLFLDDNQINVDAARQAGIDAHVVRGVRGNEGAKALLQTYGLWTEEGPA